MLRAAALLPIRWGIRRYGTLSRKCTGRLLRDLLVVITTGFK
jgi:hypothetical protein